VRALIEWWADLSPWLRFGAAGAILLLATVLLLVTGRIYVWLWALGIVLLIFSFPNSARRKGYHDF
jgi:hypothetical protein